MRTLLVAAVSALFFAAVVTELFTRLWPGQYTALLILCFVAICCAGLLNLRLAGRATAGAAARGQGPQRERQAARGAPGHPDDTD